MRVECKELVIVDLAVMTTISSVKCTNAGGLNIYFNSSSYIMLGSVGEDGEKSLQERHEMGGDLKERSTISVRHSSLHTALQQQRGSRLCLSLGSYLLHRSEVRLRGVT